MSANDQADGSDDTPPSHVRLRHDGRSTVWGGPADLDATDPDDEVVVPEEDADHYVRHHGFTPVHDPDPEELTEEESEDAEEDPDAKPPEESLGDLSYKALRGLAAGIDGVHGNQSAEGLRADLREHYAAETDETETDEAEPETEAEPESEPGTEE